MPTARVFYSDGSGNARAGDPSIAPGWYYTLDDAAPSGPYVSQFEAGKAARAEIVALASVAGLPEPAPRPDDEDSIDHMALALQQSAGCDKMGILVEYLEQATALFREGYIIAPRKPTDAMVIAAYGIPAGYGYGDDPVVTDDAAARVWAAMIEAALSGSDDTLTMSAPPTADCDCCGATVPREEIAVVMAYGIETGACRSCRGVDDDG